MKHNDVTSGAEAAFRQAILLQQSGRLADALGHYDRVIGLSGILAGAYLNRGLILEGLAKFPEALASYDLAVSLQPDAADAHYCHGNLLFRLGRLADALVSYERAIALKSGFAEALVNRGVLLAKLGRLEESVSSYERAVAIRPDLVEAHVNRGFALKELERFDEALASYERAIAVNPNSAEAHNNRGVILVELNRHAEALASYQRALAIKPDHAEAHNNLGILLAELQRYDDALASYDRAIALRPDYAEACNNRGVLLKELRRYGEAMASYAEALRLNPQFAEAWFNRAELLLLSGDFAQGWQDYEWRWRSRFRESRPELADIALWTGEQPVSGKTVLIDHEAGFGDVIMFARYAPLLRERGAAVVLQAPKPLVSLLRGLGEGITVAESGQPLPRADFRCPIMSLPRAFGTTLQTIPAALPYLDVPSEKRFAWRGRLRGSGRKRVGVVWAGKVSRNIERSPLTRRSISLALLAPWFELPLDFHVLQEKLADADADRLRNFGHVHSHQGQLLDFSDTAALIQEMDLVISVDTSVAHLAGALGKPLWVLLPYSSDYRWMPTGASTPWYPQARLFRQSEKGDWANVIRAVGQALAEMPERP